MLKIFYDKLISLISTKRLTALIIAAAFVVYISKDIEEAAQTGDFLAGFAGALAFLWLIESFQQQQYEIKMQKKEIKMQRKALELQAEELKNANKIATYNHIQQLSTESISELYNANIGIKTHSELFNIFLKDLPKYKIIFSESEDKEEIVKAWMEWWNIEQSVNIFVSKIAFSLKLYIEYKTNIQTTQNMNIDYIEAHLEEMKEIPYLEQFYGTFKNLVIPMKVSTPYLNLFRLSGTLALMLDQDDTLKEKMNKQTFKELLKNLDDSNIEYPKIYSIYQGK
jgi:hypothetical protein